MNEVKLGVIGLGRAFVASAPAILSHPSIRLRAVADPREEARTKAAAELGVATFDDAEAMCERADIDAVYIASPHQNHVEHVETCARHGKHVLVEKPMALTLEECDRMIAAADSARVALVVGPTHSFDPPVRAAREVIRSGRVGALRMLNSWVYTDFLYRPRRLEELDTARGGGVLFNQAPHHVDVVRLLGGGLVRSVRSVAGAWDPQRPTEGAYAAFLEFESGAAATIVYSGYAHFDSDELNEWVGELGERRKPEQHGAARRFLSQLAGDDEARLKADTGYGGTRSRPLDRPSDIAGHPHFGIWIASCDRADLRATPTGLHIYADGSVENVDIPRDRSEGRAGVLDELVDAINTGKPNLHDGRWGKATLEVCIAMLESSRERREVALKHQCAPNEPPK